MPAPSWWPVEYPWNAQPPQALTTEQIQGLYRLYWGRDADANDMNVWQGADPLALENALRAGRPGGPLAPLTQSTIGNQPTLDMQQFWADQAGKQAALAANPRTLVQSLLMGGTPGAATGVNPTTGQPLVGAAAVGSFLQSTPFVQQQYARAGMAAGTGAGSNPNFNYLGGRKIGWQEGMDATPSERGLMESLASFSGQDPTDWNTDWQRSRPQGRTAGASSFR